MPRYCYCVCLSVVLLAGCYTTLTPPDLPPGAEPDQTIRVEHYFVDPYGWGYRPYGYGLMSAFYLYDPFHSYYYGDPWWYTPPRYYDDEPGDGVIHTPARGTLEDGPPPPPPGLVSPPTPPQRNATPPRNRDKGETPAKKRSRGTADDPEKPSRGPEHQKRPDAQ